MWYVIFHLAVKLVLGLCPFGRAQVIVKKKISLSVLLLSDSRRLLTSSWCTLLGVPCCRLSSLCAVVTFLPVHGDDGLDKCCV